MSWSMPIESCSSLCLHHNRACRKERSGSWFRAYESSHQGLHRCPSGHLGDLPSNTYEGSRHGYAPKSVGCQATQRKVTQMGGDKEASYQRSH